MKNKLMKLMEKEGFILLLFICVCLVAGGTLFLSMKNIGVDKNVGNEEFTIVGENEEERSLYDEQMDLVNNGEEAKTVNADNSEENEEKTLEEETEEKTLEEETEVEEDLTELEEVETVDNTAEDDENLDLEFEDDDYKETPEIVQDTATISLPMDGKVLTDYTSNTLVYSETLDAWVGHEAIDIESSEGAIVKAAADGVVKEVYEDDLWGIVIVIDHGSGLQTRYSNLETKEMIKEGVSVKKGDHISKVGNTAKVEMLMKPHLHFEVIKNGKLVDPRSISD
ncbi:M23 family metallopeptidase [Tissierella sp. MB52-C2]|uniref:M23 family metallopeptidase n=1 Tax=Tissierella sp. MB52-C2 TaxID=3070999 RepID=UPI00280B97AE|nr:M23 family metallopeptidase [Tissierella sp. MB52-C2]WMM24231.1 M23 family metallopeptidase [Tissierella sp. MB52-C2]